MKHLKEELTQSVYKRSWWKTTLSKIKAFLTLHWSGVIHGEVGSNPSANTSNIAKPHAMAVKLISNCTFRVCTPDKPNIRCVAVQPWELYDIVLELIARQHANGEQVKDLYCTYYLGDVHAAVTLECASGNLVEVRGYSKLINIQCIIHTGLGQDDSSVQEPLCSYLLPAYLSEIEHVTKRLKEQVYEKYDMRTVVENGMTWLKVGHGLTAPIGGWDSETITKTNVVYY